MVKKDELQKICRYCKAPTRYPGCQDHCETGVELKAIFNRERDERAKRREAEHENRSYIRDLKERRRKRGK